MTEREIASRTRYVLDAARWTTEHPTALDMIHVVVALNDVQSGCIYSVEVSLVREIPSARFKTPLLAATEIESGLGSGGYADVGPDLLNMLERLTKTVVANASEHGH